MTVIFSLMQRHYCRVTGNSSLAVGSRQANRSGMLKEVLLQDSPETGHAAALPADARDDARHAHADRQATIKRSCWCAIPMRRAGCCRAAAWSAARRSIRPPCARCSEEAAITAEEEPHLHGVFLNDKQFPGDHVACFVLRKFSEGIFRSGLEIAEARFFFREELPVGYDWRHAAAHRAKCSMARHLTRDW